MEEKLSTRGDRLSTFRSRVANEVKTARVRGGWSLRQLSTACGVSHRSLWRIEHAKTDPRLSTLFMISDALDTPVFDFLQGQLMVSDGETKVAIGIENPAVVFRLDAIIERSLMDWAVKTFTKGENVQELAEKLVGALAESALREGLTSNDNPS